MLNIKLVDKTKMQRFKKNMSISPCGCKAAYGSVRYLDASLEVQLAHARRLPLATQRTITGCATVAPTSRHLATLLACGFRGWSTMR